MSKSPRDLVEHGDLLIMNVGAIHRIETDYNGDLFYIGCESNKKRPITILNPDLTGKHNSELVWVDSIVRPREVSSLRTVPLSELKECWKNFPGHITVWEREPEVLEVTMADIEKKYNCKIKVIK